jgi:hypothetical protein
MPVPGEQAATSERAEFERTIRNGVLYGHALSPQTLLIMIAVWKAVLFVPAMGVIFVWCRRTYGLGGAWLTQGLILVDPTLAAHIPIAALDTLAVEAIVIACFCAWRFFKRETYGSLALAAVMTAAAMLIKHTAVIMPAVILMYAAYRWWWRDLQWREKLRARLNLLLAGALIFVFAIWALLLFDISIPAEQFRGMTMPKSISGTVIDDALHRRWPAGTFIGCFVSGLLINAGGQGALLFGQISDGGWWYYFPALMTLKVPLGMWLVLIIAAGSLLRRPLRAGEMSILIPLLAWVAMLMFARLNYGFRHFLPAYIFLLMWAGRAASDAGKVACVVAWIGVAASAIHSLAFHPNEISYVNFPRERVWTQMTDSNLDWDHATRLVPRWLDDHPQPNRTVHVHPRLGRAGYAGRYYLGDRVHFVDRGKPPPTDGILIISPVWVVGVYDEPGKNPYAFLKDVEPIDMIGGALLVYDLDKNFSAATAPAARSGSSSGSTVNQPR